MQIQSTVSISNVYTKKKKKAKRWLIPLHCWLMKLSFQVMHMLQLHILCVLYWLGLLEPALYLVCMRLPGAPRGSYQCRLDSQDLSAFSKQKKKAEQSCLVLRQSDINLYIYVHIIFSLILEWFYPCTVCRKLSWMCCILSFHLHSFPGRHHCTRKILEGRISYELQDMQTWVKVQEPKFT